MDSLWSPSSILIVDDHPVSAYGMESILRAYFPENVQMRKAYAGNIALDLMLQQSPDLAIVDLDLPDISGLKVIKGIRANSPSTRIMVITGTSDPQLISQVYQLHVDAILRKTHTDHNLQEAIQCIINCSGTTYLDPSVQGILRLTEGKALSMREHEVVGFMIEGLTSSEIAARMKCSLATVKTFRARIMNKSACRNSAEIVAWYLKGNRKRNLGSKT